MGDEETAIPRKWALIVVGFGLLLLVCGVVAHSVVSLGWFNYTYEVGGWPKDVGCSYRINPLDAIGSWLVVGAFMCIVFGIFIHTIRYVVH